MHQSRNFKNAFTGLVSGMAYSALFKLIGGREPFNIRKRHLDSKQTQPADKFKVIIFLNIAN